MCNFVGRKHYNNKNYRKLDPKLSKIYFLRQCEISFKIARLLVSIK